MILTTLGAHEVIATLTALALLLLGAFTFGRIVEMCKGPRVVGEILGGMLLGGSGLFLLAPDFMDGIFRAFPEEGKVLNVFYQLGLIFLMFLSGFSTRIDMNRRKARTVAAIFLGATVIPMVASIPFFDGFQEFFIGEKNNVFSYRLVFAIGVAITSIPVISKIFFDMGIMETRFANTVLTVATFQDLCLWIFLNIATHVAESGNLDAWDTATVAVATLGMFVLVTLAGKLMRRVEKSVPAHIFYTLSFVALLLVCALLYRVGINTMYSAFIVGYIVKTLFGENAETRDRIKHLEQFTFSFFVPIYFALVGVQLNVFHDFSLARFALFFAIAFGLEFLGTWLFLFRMGRAARLNFAITMNARGGPGIVLATVAYDAKIISVEFFTVLILTTMLSSLIAGYWLRAQQKRDADVFEQCG